MLRRQEVCDIVFATGKSANIPTEFTVLKNKVKELEKRIDDCPCCDDPELQKQVKKGDVVWVPRRNGVAGHFK